MCSRVRPIDHVKLELTLFENVLVWFKADCVIDKKTLVSVPEGFKLRATCGGTRLGAPIGPCLNLNLADALGFKKPKEYDGRIFTFYYYVSEIRPISYRWGTNAPGLDREYGIDFKWGANGNYQVSVEDPLRLVEWAHRANPVTKDRVDKIENEILFTHVTQQLKGSVAKLLADKQIHVLEISKCGPDISKEVMRELSCYRGITSDMGLKFTGFAIAGIALCPDDEEARVRAVIEEKRRAAQGG